MSSNTGRTYIPAAGRDWLLPLYDGFLRLTGAEAVKRALVEQGTIAPAHRVLDLGCGTGTLVVLMKRLHPKANFTAIDPDPKALARAREKALRSGVEIRFDEGFAQELPYADDSFDRVFSSFMFHHLQPSEKQSMLKESLRVLRPQGEMHLLDFAPAKVRKDGLIGRLVHRDAELSDNANGRIAMYLTEAGFGNAQECSGRHTLFGRVGFYRATKPAV